MSPLDTPILEKEITNKIRIKYNELDLYIKTWIAF